MKKLKMIPVLLCLINIQAFACSCYEYTLKEQVNLSQIVLKGKVVSKVLTRDLSTLSLSKTSDTTNIMYKMSKIILMAVIKVKVERFYKGKISADTITVLTPNMSASCGARLEVGSDYIIYGTNYDSVLASNKFTRKSKDIYTYWTSNCTRTGLWYAEEEKQIKTALQEQKTKK